MPLLVFGGPFGSKKVVLSFGAGSSALGKLIVYRLVFRMTCFNMKYCTYFEKRAKKTFFRLPNLLQKVVGRQVGGGGGGTFLLISRALKFSISRLAGRVLTFLSIHFLKKLDLEGQSSFFSASKIFLRRGSGAKSETKGKRKVKIMGGEICYMENFWSQSDPGIDPPGARPDQAPSRQ